MCGIAGAVNWGNRETLTRMVQIQHHRGPDDGGVWETALRDGQWVGLGSRRLSILDLTSAGHMPMSTTDGDYTIVYNGEIYNFSSLRAELEARGYKFRSNTDTETVLYLYQEFGAACLNKLNGMFALAIWDHGRQELFLARDHFGIKPLYYVLQGDKLAFASEAKALLLLPDIERKLDLTALNQYLAFLWVPEPLTLFANIRKLPAGHYAVFKERALQLHQYWDLRFPETSHAYSDDLRELAAEVREHLCRAVRSQMLSDVPVGAFLSAGLDSSSIVSCMARASSSPISTYTIAFPENQRRGEVTLDDTAVARRTAEYFGCRHTEILVEPDVVSLLPKLVWHMDEPTADPAIIAAYLVNREARKSSTVLLSGVGGDEVFAGYRKYRAHYLAERYQKVPTALRRHVLEPLVQSIPTLRGTAWKGYVRLAKKMARSGSLPPKERFVLDGTYLTDDQRGALLTDEFARALEHDARERHMEWFANIESADFLNQMLYVDSKTFMVSLNLNYNDKMSMASSVEVRVPFLDREFVEWAACHISPEMKLHGGKMKYILRQAMCDDLPPEVLDQPKMGFGAPVDYWLAGGVGEMVDDLLSPDQVRKRGIFDPLAVSKLIRRQRSGQEDWSMQLWQLLTLEIWLRTFMDRPQSGWGALDAETLAITS